VESFAVGLRAALRECPDIILVGEMRDRETVALALTAAETGHLVLSTLHSGSAAMAIDRIVDIFPDTSRRKSDCKWLARCARWSPSSCWKAFCLARAIPRWKSSWSTTRSGRSSAEGKTHQLTTQIQTGRDDGMVALDASLLDLARAGRISREVALAAARDPSSCSAVCAKGADEKAHLRSCAWSWTCAARTQPPCFGID